VISDDLARHLVERLSFRPGFPLLGIELAKELPKHSKAGKAKAALLHQTITDM
jgi:hypothetical protein